MNRALAAVLAIALACAALYAAYRFGAHERATTATAPAAAASASGDQVDPNAGRKVLYWHDPMVPGQKFDKPGKSPFMDMQLVPVYADEAGDEGTVSISPRVVQNLGVRTAEVVQGSLERRTQAVGSVAYNERELIVLQARVAGFVERLNVRAPLDAVRKGQALVEMLVPDWVAAQEEYLALRTIKAADADTLRSAARQRMQLAGMSAEAVRALEETGKVQARSVVHSPIDGVVSELSVREGMTVTAGAPLFRINGLGSVWINVEVPEAQASTLKPGQSAEVKGAALGGTVLKGRIQALLPQVNAATRTLTARIEVPNPKGALAPGMFVTAEISQTQNTGGLLVPTEAVIQTGTRVVVIEALGDGKFRPVEVEMGTEANGRTEIRKGLQAGRKVVVSGQFLIDSEASLKSTLARMGSGEKPDTKSAPPRPGAAGPQLHRGEGKVESVGKDEVTISHGPVPTMQWPAMTMSFKNPPSGAPPDLSAGDAVSFEFTQAKEGQFALTRITRQPAKGAPK